MENDFRKFATKHLGINSLVLDQYVSAMDGSYISPTIIEERQLNVASMDIFSRLMIMSQTLYKDSYYIWNRLIRQKTFKYI